METIKEVVLVSNQDTRQMQLARLIDMARQRNVTDLHIQINPLDGSFTISAETFIPEYLRKGSEIPHRWPGHRHRP